MPNDLRKNTSQPSEVGMKVFFFGALDQNRALEDKEKIIKDYYHSYQDQVLVSPETHRMDYVHAFTVIEKI